MAIRGRLVQPDPFDMSRERVAGERDRHRMENGTREGYRHERLTESPWHDLLVAIFDRAWNDVKGVAMSGVRKRERDIIQAEAAEFLAWAQQEATSDEHLPEW